MSIKTIPLSQLEANPRRTLIECAESGQAFVIEVPEQRFVAIQPIAAAGEDDSLTSDLLESNAAFRALVAKSKESPRKPFAPQND